MQALDSLNGRLLFASSFLLYLLFVSFSHATVDLSPFYQPNLSISKKEAENTANNSLFLSVTKNQGEVYKIRFQWFDQVGAAFFQRDGYTWLIFDHFIPYFNPISLRAISSDLDDFKIIPNIQGLILRFHFYPDVQVQIEQERLAWNLIVSKKKLMLKIPVDYFSALPISNKLDVLFSTEYPEKVLHFQDPLLGDELWVGTVSDRLFAYQGRNNFPGFRTVNTKLGIVISTLSKKVSMQINKKGYYILVPLEPGVTLNPFGKSTTESNRLFNFKAWRGDPDKTFLDKKDFLENASSLIIDKLYAKDRAYLDLAKFYLAYGLPIQSLGYIKLIKSKNTTAFSIEAADNLLMGRTEEAKRMFLTESNLIPENMEKKIWKAFLLEKLGQYKKSLDLYNKNYVQFIMEDYPNAISSRFFLSYLVSAVHDKEISTGKVLLEGGKPLLDPLQDMSMQYQKGKWIELQKNGEQNAYDYYQKLIPEIDPLKDPYNYYRVLYEWVELGVKLKKIKLVDAKEVLNQIHMMWRGGDLEEKNLKFLLNLQIQTHDYLAALQTLEEMKSNTSDLAKKKMLIKEMHNLFVNSFLSNEQVKKNLSYALVIYNKYRFLVSEVQDVRPILNTLIDLMIKNNSLNRAANLLRFTIQRYAVNATDQLQLGIKLIYIDLILNDPKKALSDFEEMRLSESSDKTLVKRLSQLKAQIFILLQKYQDAMNALAGYIDPISDHLRLQVYWKTKNWVAMIRVFQRLVGTPSISNKKLSNEQARYLLEWVIALKMNGNQNGINLLHRLYGHGMKNTPYEGLYNFILAPQITIFHDLEKTLKSLTQKDNFQQFMKDFKNAVKNADLPS